MNNWPKTTIQKSSYLKGRIGWQGLRASEFLEEGPFLITGTDFQHGKIDRSNCYHVSEERYNEASYIHVKDNDLLITKDGTIGKIALVEKCPSKAVLNSGIFLLRSKNASYDHNFAYYILTSEIFEKFLRLNLNGSTINHLYQYVFEKFELPIPPPEVQQKIAGVLRTVDHAIASTEALIEKYQHIKAGLMHDLFTRGIGADGKLRPPREQAPELYQESVIGWIPKEWIVHSLGELSDISSGVTLGSKRALDQTINVTYLSVANVQDGYLDLHDIKEILVNRKTFENLLLKQGDVLMNEGGDFDKLGRGTVWQCEIEPCIHQNHVFRVRTDSQRLQPFFLAYWSQSIYGKRYFVLSSKQSTNLASINSTQLKKFPIALPFLEEQREIEHRIDIANTKIDSLKKESRKLAYQKNGLMHDLLTGKVPVTPDATVISHS